MKKMVLCRKNPSDNGGRANANGDFAQGDSENEPDDSQHLSGSRMSTRSKSRSNLFKTLRFHWLRCKGKTSTQNGIERWAECPRDTSEVSGPASPATGVKSSVCCSSNTTADEPGSEMRVPALSSEAQSPSDANDNYVRNGANTGQGSTLLSGDGEVAEAQETRLASDTALFRSTHCGCVPPRVLPDLRIKSLTQELFKLSKHGWYWGPITRCEAEEKLVDQPDGAFLVRDSSDDRYLLSLTFKSYGKTLHTRIEHCNGLFSFYAQSEPEGRASIVDLIQESMNYSQSGTFCYSRGRNPGVLSFPVRLIKPVSRLTHVRTLQYLCRFVIRQYTRFDHIQNLPLPSRIKGYLEESHY